MLFLMLKLSAGLLQKLNHGGGRPQCTLYAHMPTQAESEVLLLKTPASFV